MKRVIVVSDSHGEVQNLRECFAMAQKKGRIDAAVFLGDGADDFAVIRQELEASGVQCYAVAGNNDWRCDDPKEIIFSIGGVRFYACHGHTRHVKYGLDRLWYAARENEAQVVLYGHTHVPDITLDYGLQLVNPGAVCSRRPKGAAFAEIRVENDGTVFPNIVCWE